jgi:DNA-binding transcriptional ArsR family regulator
MGRRSSSKTEAITIEGGKEAMHARIILGEGVVIEAEGTAIEIANLAAALRQSHQLPEPAEDASGPRTGMGCCGDSESGDVPMSVDPVIEDSQALDVDEDGGVSWRSDLDGDHALDAEHAQDELEGADQVDGAEYTSSVTIASTRPSSEPAIRAVADQFRLLGDPTRLQILSTLAEGGHNVGEICEALGGQSQPGVSHHLALLRVSGLVTPSRDGKFNLYELTELGRTLTPAVSWFGAAEGRSASEVFRQVSDPTRLQILLILAEGDRNVGELCSDLGGQSQPAVSHHLALLRNGGLIEARREGKFSFYSLRKVGRELIGVITPKLSARPQKAGGEGGDTFNTEDIDFSVMPDDWMDDAPTSSDEANEPGEDEESPTGHILCRRVLQMVLELHRRGYERLRVAPGMSPSGLHWRCSIVPVTNIRRDHGAMVLDHEKESVRYTSGQESRFFDWTDAERDSPAELADKFIERFRALAAMGRGRDPEYARWYAEMHRATDPGGLIYAYADWELPEDHLPALGCTAEVEIPLPPAGEGASGTRTIPS